MEELREGGLRKTSFRKSIAKNSVQLIIHPGHMIDTDRLLRQRSLANLIEYFLWRPTIAFHSKLLSREDMLISEEINYRVCACHKMMVIMFLIN